MNCSTVYGLESNVSLEIARGNIGGSTPFGAYGKKVATGAISETILWGNGDWNIPNQTTGEQIQIQSTSIEDGVSGSGIRSVHIHYLDSNLIDQDEIVFLDGINPVLTVATDVRFIQCAHLDTYGSAKESVGDITFTRVADTSTIFNELPAANKRCSSSARMIPSGKRCVVIGIAGSSISGTAAASSLVSIGVSYFQGHDYTEDAILMPIGTIGMQDGGLAYNLPIPHIAPQGTIVGMTCSSDKAATITGDWFGWLENI